MGLDLYYHFVSPQFRAIRLTARAIGLDINLKPTWLDPRSGATHNVRFPGHAQHANRLRSDRLTPQHLVPTLYDHAAGQVLWESRAIQIYLVRKYGQGEVATDLYPTDVRARAVVNQRLFFDCETLYSRFADAWYPQVFDGRPPEPDALERVYEALDAFEAMLGESGWAAGERLTLADISLITTVSTIELTIGFDPARFVRVVEWQAACREAIIGYKEDFKEALECKQIIGCFYRLPTEHQ